jgi:MFS family permease
MGYSLSYAVAISSAERTSLAWFVTKNLSFWGLPISWLQGWRWAWYICALPGLVLGPLIFLSVKEPERRNHQKIEESEEESENTDENEDLISSEPQLKWTEKAKMLLKLFLQPTIILLCLGGSIRNAG